MWPLETIVTLNIAAGAGLSTATINEREAYTLETRARKAQARRKALSGGKVVPRGYYEGGKFVGWFTAYTNQWVQLVREV